VIAMDASLRAPPAALQVTVAALLAVGGVFALVGAIGLLRFPDFYMPLHVPTEETTLAVGGVMVASRVPAWARRARRTRARRWRRSRMTGGMRRPARPSRPSGRRQRGAGRPASWLRRAAAKRMIAVRESVQRGSPA